MFIKVQSLTIVEIILNLFIVLYALCTTRLIPAQPRKLPVKIFSLSHVIELAAQLPDPAKALVAESGYNAVVRLPILDWDAVRDADHPERKFEAHEQPFVEFELIQWKDTRGHTTPRCVLRGLVAI